MQDQEDEDSSEEHCSNGDQSDRNTDVVAGRKGSERQDHAQHVRDDSDDAAGDDDGDMHTGCDDIEYTDNSDLGEGQDDDDQYSSTSGDADSDVDEAGSSCDDRDAGTGDDEPGAPPQRSDLRKRTVPSIGQTKHHRES